MTPTEILDIEKKFIKLKKEFEQNKSENELTKLCHCKMQQIKLSLNKMTGPCGIIDFHTIKEQVAAFEKMVNKLKERN